MIADISRALLLLVAACSVQANASAGRVFEFSYDMNAQNIPAGQVVDIYIPRPSEQMGQRILDAQVQTNLPMNEGLEAGYRNGYYHFQRPADSDAPIDISIRWQVSRDTRNTPQQSTVTTDQHQKFLAANTLVPVNDPILEPILAEIHEIRADDSRQATARAIYDWVVDNVEYKKVGSGWGNGDTFWACNERYGNCTDFHALFISLARSEGIPARFEIGFPVPNDRPLGEVAGYHCWVQFHLPEQGWLPIDASAAAKNPAKREQYYGTQPNDRIHFTTGRDLIFTSATEEAPLNYFIYPHIEVAGKVWQKKVETRFQYRELAQVASQ